MRMVNSSALKGVGLGMALVTMAACQGEKKEAADSSAAGMAAPAAAASMAGKWTATMMPMAGTTIGGTATVMAGSAAETTVAEVMITAAPANEALPWHVHAGTCAGGGDVVGPAAEYKPMQTDASGKASALATLPMAMPTTGEYHVNVHKSASDMGTIVSCGDLKMGAM